MISKKTEIDESLRFVAKHYKKGIFNPEKKFAKITGKNRYFIQPAIFGRVAAIAIILVVVGIVIINRNNGEMIIAKGNPTISILPDQSEIKLQPGATLAYDKNFGKSTREVKITGNVSFRVARDVQKPFIVHASDANIKVLGTTFDVNQNIEGVTLSVHSGKVQFTPTGWDMSFICVKDENATYKASENKITITKPHSLYSINLSSNQLTFSNTQLDEVCNLIENYYKININLKTNESDLTLTSSFENKSALDIIKIINLTLDTHISIEN